jgi:hypothetical protein
MGSHSTQGVGISIFLIAFVALGLFFAGGGIIFLLAFLALIGVSIVVMRKCKAMESAAE